MKSKTLINIALLVLVIVGLFAWGYAGRVGTTASVQGASGASGTSKSVLTAPENFYDFGTISMKNGNVSKEFQVSNSTGEDITISTVFTSCMCTLAYIVGADGSAKGPFGMPGMGYVPPADETIHAGESRVVRVIYNPNAHGPAGVGRIDRFVTLTDSRGGTLELEIKALVTP
ncbi:hypothetical protein A3F27_00065 [Candidatus Kaiserbacteria bacterium RIFCSPHIGHO2_12_FULL_53_13]|uniref:DUF1573 domain-containing protein n=1 Tax=Candidatus Kaiserbacteria bacterium RIFCSPHIGHO2_12_FULL_53_13 TaxID=1798502 RepID=A0A1F6EC71_9BACT|nr:MAG: hypothetical protein A3F27_00065 [Candidatus Kaiserbacteria bacterium RIFCSPHIGHO2_12_FULL_53_13]OGG74288.1 MAG: hypothetical protein A3A37_03130 [Candidatus Kaiserbacteria bacterium RIFCSPLOWO2_01_FULL_52_36]